jgi:hypothetical protein
MQIYGFISTCKMKMIFFSTIRFFSFFYLQKDKKKEQHLYKKYADIL